MIQRIQTIYLLLVVALGITLCFEPILTFNATTEDGVQRVWNLGAMGLTETTEFPESTELAETAELLETTELAETAEVPETPIMELEPVSLNGVWGLLVATLLIPLLALADIFLYKKRIAQSKLNIFLTMLCIGYYGVMGIYIWFANMNIPYEGIGWHITPWLAIPLVCFVLTIMATRRILKDEALVRAADRLR